MLLLDSVDSRVFVRRHSSWSERPAALQCRDLLKEDSDTGVCGQQGLPVRLEPELEAEREKQVSGEQRWAPGEGRSVQLEQQPDSLWAGVDGERLSELWGHTERSAGGHWTGDETAVFRVDLLLFSLMCHMETNSTWATPSFSTSASAALLCVLHTRLYVCFSIHSGMILNFTQ